MRLWKSFHTKNKRRSWAKSKKFIQIWILLFPSLFQHCYTVSISIVLFTWYSPWLYISLHLRKTCDSTNSQLTTNWWIFRQKKINLSFRFEKVGHSWTTRNIEYFFHWQMQKETRAKIAAKQQQVFCLNQNLGIQEYI